MHAVLHYLRFRLKLLPFVEGLIMLQAMLTGAALTGLVQPTSRGPLMMSIGFTALMLLGFTAGSLYDARRPNEIGRIALRFAAAYCAAIVLLAAASLILPLGETLDRPFFTTTLVATLITFGVRIATARSSLFQLPPRRVVVVGDGPEAHEVARILHTQKDRRSAREVSRCSLVNQGRPISQSEGPLHGELAEMIEQERPEEIVVAVRERRGGGVPQRDLLRAKVSGIRVTGLLTFYERELGLIKLQHLLSGWIIYGPGFDQGRLRSVIKRTFDLAVSSLLLLLAAPVMVVAGLAVRLESPGPAFFRQTRVRDGGQTFQILKFRSMRTDAEKEGKPIWASVGDPRITRVGNVIRKLRIDELPQLINVLRGEMSFVGPRPERPYFVDQLVERCPFYDIRHSIRPGITGWAQVRLPYGASIDDAMNKLEFDLYYVKNHSLFLDVMILFETIRVVLNKAGAR